MINSSQIESHAENMGHHSARWLRSRYATPVLALIAFAESVFFPILIDPFLVALILAKPEAWKRYIGVSIIASVVGGVVAYFLAAFFFDQIVAGLIAFEHFETQFESISSSLNDNALVFTLIGAITPIPYKLVALAAGFLKINFGLFLIASIVGRFIRLGFVGYIAYRFGPHALRLFHSRFNVVISVLLVVVVTFVLTRYL